MRTLAERFVAVCSGGDLDGLMELLDPDIEGTGTRVGHGPIGHFHGPSAVARNIMRFVGPGTGTMLVPLDLEQDLAVVAFQPGHFATVIRLEAPNGRIEKIDSFVWFHEDPEPADKRPSPA